MKFINVNFESDWKGTRGIFYSKYNPKIRKKLILMNEILQY